MLDPMNVNGYLTWLRASGAAPGTIKLRRHYLQALERDCGRLEGLTSPVVCQWLAGHVWAPETRKSARASVLGFAGWAHLELEVPTVRVPRAMPRPCPEDVYQAALRAAAPDVRVMLRLAGACGLRRAEIAAVKGEDIDHGWLRVTGKGGKVRRIPVPSDIPTRPGWLFPGRFGGHLNPDTVGHKLHEAIGMGGHTLRHRYATVCYQHTHDLRAVQELLGHASPTTTARYTAVDDQHLANVAAVAA